MRTLNRTQGWSNRTGGEQGLMNIVDALQEILFSLRKNKLRTFLTGFGVFWGIFMLILLLGSGKGLRNGVEAGFSSDVKDSVWIFARKTSIPYMGMSANRDIRLTEQDIEAIEQEIPGVLYVTGENPLGSVNRSNILVRAKDRSENFGVFGVADHYFKIKKFQELRKGRKLNSNDESETRKVASIGTKVAETLFPDQDPVGQSIEINGVSFTVIGVFFDDGNNGQMSERIYVPMSLYQKTYGKGEPYIRILAYQPRAGFDPHEVEKQVVALLQQRHKVHPDDRSAIRSRNLLDAAANVNAIFAAINAIIWFVGVGTLSAGIVGISNIMMITVKERTVEIGVRKALGATPVKIVSTLLFESVLVTGIAGYLGLVLGVGLLELVNYGLTSSGADLAFFKRPEVDFRVAVISIILLVSVGVIAGFAPAWRAARISPVEAMRAG
jgi:putative ABC transport system permease protein